MNLLGESACNVGDLGLIPGLGRSPGGGHGNPLLYSCMENPHGQRSLVGYSPWGHKDLDMTEQLSMRACAHTQTHTHTDIHTHTHTHTHIYMNIKYLDSIWYKKHSVIIV